MRAVCFLPGEVGASTHPTGMGALATGGVSSQSVDMAKRRSIRKLSSACVRFGLILRWGSPLA